MPYRIDTYTKAEVDDPEIFETVKDAMGDMDNLRLMFPDDIHRLVDVETGRVTFEHDI